MSSDELEELKKISKILTIANGSSLEKELEKYATTEDRKKIWVLIDGKNQTKEIMKRTGLYRRTIEKFLDQLETVDLIDERKYGIPPRRKLDYIPPTWSSLIPSNIQENKSDTTESKQTGENSG